MTKLYIWYVEVAALISHVDLWGRVVALRGFWVVTWSCSGSGFIDPASLASRNAKIDLASTYVGTAVLDLTQCSRFTGNCLGS